MLFQIFPVKLILTALTATSMVMSPIPKITDHTVYTSHQKRQIECLAQNMYFEARGQSEKGMIAVTNVVYNRIKDKRFPKTECDVIHQKNGRVCQFSWTCSKRKVIIDWDSFSRAKRLAERAVRGELNDVTHGAVFYHASYVNPGWRHSKLAQIGSHVFYSG